MPRLVEIAGGKPTEAQHDALRSHYMLRGGIIVQADYCHVDGRVIVTVQPGSNPCSPEGRNRYIIFGDGSVYRYEGS